jgi:hypothetical protein
MLRKSLGNLVDLDGFEPSTSSMPWKRAPNCATGPPIVCNSTLPYERCGLPAVGWGPDGLRRGGPSAPYARALSDSPHQQQDHDHQND